MYIYGKEITLSDVGLSSNDLVISLQNLEDLILKCENIRPCKGAKSSKDCSHLKSTLQKTCMENCGQLHHVNCPYILQENEE